MAQQAQIAGESGLPEHERLYRALRQRILDGGMAPGEAVTLRGLAEVHGVSMTPAREAVRRLVAERALAMTPSGRVSVPVPDAATMEELFRARMLLEPELATRAAPRLTTAAIAQLERHDAEVERHFRNGDAAGYVRANIRFHAAIYERAEAPALLALVQSVWLQSTPLMRQVHGLVTLSRMPDFHQVAIAAAKIGEAAAFASAIRDDVAQGATLLARARLDAMRL